MTWRVVLLWFCLALPALAQSGKKQSSADPDPAMQQVHALLAAPNGAYQISQELLLNSFALRRNWDGAKTPVDLAELYAIYNSPFHLRISRGALILHLAQAMAALDAIDTPEARYRHTVILVRLLWAAGQHDNALRVSRAFLQHSPLLPQQTVSLLADAAILEHFLGDPATGQAHLNTAQSCQPGRCPTDLILGWLGEKRQALDKVPDIFDLDRARQLAQDLVLRSFDNDPVLHAEIDREVQFMRGAGARLFETALEKTDKPDLSDQDRRHLRAMADRALAADGYLEFQMNYDSVASNILRNLRAGKPPEPDHGSIGYLLFPDFNVSRNLPLVYEMMRATDDPLEQIVADTFLARLLFKFGQRDRAIAILRNRIAAAKEGGAWDQSLFSVYADLWAMADIHGAETIAAEAWQALTPCLSENCDTDYLTSYFTGLDLLAKTPMDGDLTDLRISAAEQFLRRELPGDMIALADIYRTGPSQPRPMDAAERAAISFGFAEQASDISLLKLSKYASDTMDVLTYAGQYNAAFDIGARLSARFPQAAPDDFHSHFHARWARSAHRLDHPKTHEIYKNAVERGNVGDLHLDLLDTPFLDLLDLHLTNHPELAETQARLRIRQGRPAEAAEVLRNHRFALAQTQTFREPLIVYFGEIAAHHLRNGQLEPHLQALDQMNRVLAGEVPAEHPLLYGDFSARLRDIAVQEAHYRQLAGNRAEAARLRDLAQFARYYQTPWPALPKTPDAEAIARFQARSFQSWNSYDYIRDIIDLRDKGSYEAAALKLRTFRWLAMAAQDNRAYVDAQTLWQMAFTFARAGDSDIAFDLMNRAARIAANLSYEGAGEGTLQLLERDRWRYLLFIDIAWSAATGQTPEEMTVVVRY